MSNPQVVSAPQPGRAPWRQALLLGLSLPIFTWVASQAPLAQDQTYHHFADRRWLYGVPHFWNVVSNAPFAVIGMLGCWWVIRAGRTSPAFMDPRERAAYLAFFAGELLTCFGSGYYHAGPTNASLMWDRLAFSVMLTSIFSIVVAEFVNRRVGRFMLAPMVGLGLISVLHWARSESLGQGDLRFYLLVQFYPMLAIPLILLLFRSRYTHGGAFWLMWALYGVAKLAEVADGRILEWSGFWSGHTVKHLVAAGASSIPLYILQRRRERAEPQQPSR